MNNSNYKHGGYNTKLYIIWRNMKTRCQNKNNISYKNYGGRGITICNEWLEFIPFRDWSLNNSYQEGLEIDRIDNDGNYEPNNCRWVIHSKNTQNRRTTKLSLEKANEIRELHKTRDYTLNELGKKYSVDFSTIYQIIHNKIWR